jgi:hypothetical protein
MAARSHARSHHVSSKWGAFQRIRSNNYKERSQLLSTVSFILGGILVMGTLVYFTQKSHEYFERREESWNSAIGTVIDTRTHLVAETGGNSGGRMLYEVQVLAAFSADGSSQERWITVDQAPQGLDYAEFQERLWRGKQYFVRWNPSNPNQIVIDLH